MAESTIKSDDTARDFELMVLVRDGDQRSFREIVERHQQGLLNFFRKMGIFNDADDLVQDTFIRLYKYRDRYEPKARFTTFLYMMARQVRMDYLRKVQRRSAIELEAHEAVHLKEEESYSESEMRRPDAQSLLNGLSEDARELIVLSIYKGMTYHEISEISGIAVGTIKSRVFTAMRKMREILDAEGYGGRG